MHPQQAYPLGKGTHKVPFLVSQTSPPPLLEAKDQITTWLEDVLADPDFAHAFLVEAKVTVTGRVEIFLDADTGVDLELCRRVSRALEERLDETQLLGEKYTLEISSPGPSRPLTNPRQFPKHLGRTLEVQRVEGDPITGVLADASTEQIVLTEEVVRKENNKKTKEQLRHEVPFANLRGATVQFSFK